MSRRAKLARRPVTDGGSARAARYRGHVSRFSSVLIANRGEIAVRVIRACADAGLTSIAVYAEPDRDAPHVRLADEAYALGGSTAAETYLDIVKIIDVAKRSGAEAIHPGYGFLSENATFAQAVIDAGLTWIGPPPAAIEGLGDKVSARHIAQRAGAPLVPGTKDPVANADEVLAFADEHGLPVAIKAAFGGGGRGLKVARTRDEIPEPIRLRYPRGRRRLWPRRVLRGALPRQASSRRDPVPRGQPRQRRGRLHARLLAAAPSPEGWSRRPPRRSSPTSRTLVWSSPPRPSSWRPATRAPAPVSSWSGWTAPSPSSRSTRACRWNTP
ncbi:hypothetical protein GCM10025876_10240 [Demequina litorisediminis]|uniref:biotin carboxylase n=1 Tax=Demequina litorisediminis TaxID=1849022 RepID=A0ABQ6IAR4_9MICO|nr:hypothetical protein GCM10025876_10240 [Demequina litorisediminis]